MENFADDPDELSLLALFFRQSEHIVRLRDIEGELYGREKKAWSRDIEKIYKIWSKRVNEN